MSRIHRAADHPTGVRAATYLHRQRAAERRPGRHARPWTDERTVAIVLTLCLLSLALLYLTMKGLTS